MLISSDDFYYFLFLVPFARIRKNDGETQGIGNTETVSLGADNDISVVRSFNSGLSEYMYYDYNQSLRFTTDGTGALKAAYDYYPYGIPIYSMTNSDTDADPTFASHTQDEESGNYYAKQRYYDPETGRFNRLDPIMDGLNWYAYCGGDPVNSYDPWGLAEWIDGDPKDPVNVDTPSDDDSENAYTDEQRKKHEEEKKKRIEAWKNSKFYAAWQYYNKNRDRFAIFGIESFFDFYSMFPDIEEYLSGKPETFKTLLDLMKYAIWVAVSSNEEDVEKIVEIYATIMKENLDKVENVKDVKNLIKKLKSAESAAEYQIFLNELFGLLGFDMDDAIIAKLAKKMLKWDWKKGVIVIGVTAAGGYIGTANVFLGVAIQWNDKGVTISIMFSISVGMGAVEGYSVGIQGYLFPGKQFEDIKRESLTIGFSFGPFFPLSGEFIWLQSVFGGNGYNGTGISISGTLLASSTLIGVYITWDYTFISPGLTISW